MRGVGHLLGRCGRGTILALLVAALTAGTAQAAAPVITGFTPTSGTAGTPLTISGKNLSSATKLTIAGVPATITSNTSTAIGTTIPSGAVTGVVEVGTAGGRYTSPKTLTILALTSFAPTSGPPGTAVTINGSGFNASSTVQFAGQTATVSHHTATQIVADVPAGASPGTISATNTTAPVGTAVSAASYTVTPAIAPSISSFTPGSGITGSSVTLTGNDFSGASSVKFGTRPTSFTVNSPTSITATVPDGAKPGAISVTTAVDTATSSTNYLPTFSVTGLAPSSDLAGSSMIINGAGFTSTSAVTFNGVPATITHRSLPGRLVVIAPADAPSGPVMVTNTVAPVGTVQSPMNFNPEICGTTSVAPQYQHVIVLYEENHSFGDIIGSSAAPYINELASQCGLATNYHSITHPSLPEYIASTSGLSLSQLHPFFPDCIPSVSCESSANNIFNETPFWKGYAESMPSNCDQANAGVYAPRHNPAVYYTDLGNCVTQDVPLGTTTSSPLLSDFASENTAPSFATVTPNLCDDMHGTSSCSGNIVTDGDNWLKQWIPAITQTPVYENGDTVIFVVWDEGEGGSGVTGEACAASIDPSCIVPTMVIAPSVKGGLRVGRGFNHYSLLKTEEDLLGEPELGSSQNAVSMASAFGL